MALNGKYSIAILPYIAIICYLFAIHIFLLPPLCGPLSSSLATFIRYRVVYLALVVNGFSDDNKKGGRDLRLQLNALARPLIS